MGSTQPFTTSDNKPDFRRDVTQRFHHAKVCIESDLMLSQPTPTNTRSDEDPMDHAQSLDGLLDKAAITDVIHAYCYHFDRAEAEKVLALFTADAVVDYGPDVPTMTGLDEISPMIERGLASFFAATSHHISNIQIAFERPDAASSVSYLYAWHRYQDGRPNSELWGQYHHDFQRTPEGWKIARLYLCAAGSKDFHRDAMHPIGRRKATLSA
jgi:ketosteroid isomerase-like protein